MKLEKRNLNNLELAESEEQFLELIDDLKLRSTALFEFVKGLFEGYPSDPKAQLDAKPWDDIIDSIIRTAYVFFNMLYDIPNDISLIIASKFEDFMLGTTNCKNISEFIKYIEEV